MREEVKERKVRSDKKRQIKPTISNDLFDCISAVSYITNSPLKDIGEFIVMEAMNNTSVIEYVSKHLRREYWHNGTMYIGDSTREKYTLPPSIKKKRLTITFTQEFAEELDRLAFSLGTFTSTATSLVLQNAMKNKDIVNYYFQNKINYTLDENRKKQLKNVYKYVVKDSPFNEHVSIIDLIKSLFEK